MFSILVSVEFVVFINIDSACDLIALTSFLACISFSLVIAPMFLSSTSFLHKQNSKMCLLRKTMFIYL